MQFSRRAITGMVLSGEAAIVAGRRMEARQIAIQLTQVLAAGRPRMQRANPRERSRERASDRDAAMWALGVLAWDCQERSPWPVGPYEELGDRSP